MVELLKDAQRGYVQVSVELALPSPISRYTTTKLGKVVENVLKQNNTLDLEEMYFEVPANLIWLYRTVFKI